MSRLMPLPEKSRHVQLEVGREGGNGPDRSSPDSANGLICTVVKNIPPDATETKLSFLTVTPKPQLAKLVIVPEGEEMFSVGGRTHRDRAMS